MENTPEPNTTHTPGPSVANTPDFNTANTPAPICDECGSNPAHPAQFATPKPWCADCIMDRLDLARDDETSYPFVVNGVAQDPTMPEYDGIFGETYILGWRMYTSVWEVPSEFRLYCDCNRGSFVGELEPDNPEPYDYSCPGCCKFWCLRCGDPAPEALGDFCVHSDTTITTYCKNLWDTKEAARQQLYQGLQGRDYQLCLRCNVYTEERDEELRTTCAACDTGFCFSCGLMQEDQEDQEIPEWVEKGHCECSGAEGSVDSQEPAEETTR